jgi:SAM-dependent methyltransferase
MKTCHLIAECPEEKRIVFVKNGYSIKECNKCAYRFCEPDNLKNHLANVYADSYFFGGEEGYPNYLEEKGILIKQGVRYARIIRRYVDKPGSILDVGSAAGFILKGFEQQGWTCRGLEPNKTMTEYGVKELDLNIQVGDLETFETDDRFDLITLIQVIGHFHNIDKAIQKANELLKPGGFIVVESWDRSSAIARIFGKHWHEYSPPSVIHWFSEKLLIDFFNFYGFKLINKGFPVKQINLKHAVSLIDGKTPNFVLKKRIFKLLGQTLGGMKVYYPPVDLKWFLFQKIEAPSNTLIAQ